MIPTEIQNNTKHYHEDTISKIQNRKLQEKEGVRRKSEQANLWINRQIQCMVFGSLFEQTTLKHTHTFMRQENSNTGLFCNIKKLFYIFLSMTMVLQLLFLKAHCLKYLWLKLHMSGICFKIIQGLGEKGKYRNETRSAIS